jgi:hypothetical protein
MRIKVIEKKQFDTAIVNPQSNLELTNLLNPIVIEFKEKNKLSSYDRGSCFARSNDFIQWLKKTYPALYENLLNKGIDTMEGLFQIDNPPKLPLEISDLYDDEFEDFLDKHGEEYSRIEGKTNEISELIWKWAKENLERLDDFYYMSHGWVEVDNLIIDFTWPQFKNSINDKVPLIERYEYL